MVELIGDADLVLLKFIVLQIRIYISKYVDEYIYLFAFIYFLCRLPKENSRLLYKFTRNIAREKKAKIEKFRYERTATIFKQLSNV